MTERKISIYGFADKYNTYHPNHYFKMQQFVLKVKEIFILLDREITEHTYESWSRQYHNWRELIG